MEITLTNGIRNLLTVLARNEEIDLLIVKGPLGENVPLSRYYDESYVEVHTLGRLIELESSLHHLPPIVSPIAALHIFGVNAKVKHLKLEAVPRGIAMKLIYTLRRDLSSLKVTDITRPVIFTDMPDDFIVC